AQGTKEDQRAGFYRYQRPYISSKSQSAYARSDSLSLRANGVSDFTVTPYSDVYVHVKFGEAHSVKLRGKQGEVIPIVCEADTANDLETYLYSAGSISRLGSLAGLMASEIELNSAVKLRNLPLGSDEPGYDNRDLTQLSFGTINNLEVIDLSGLGALTGTLDLTQFDSLREFYGSGCGITGVVFAPNAPVETAILPQVSTLVLRGQRQLRQFRMEGSKLINLRVEDTPMADTLTLVRSAKNLQRGRLLGVNWPDADGDTLLRLAGLTGYDENTRPTDRFVLTGFAHVPTIAQDELDVLHRIFPNLEITAGAIVPYYPVTFQNEDGTILYSQNVRQGGTCPDPIATGDISTPTKEPTVGETFVFGGWDFPLTNVQGPLTLTAQFASQVRKYTVRWFDGGRLLQTDVVEAFEPVSYRGSDLLPEADRLWVGWNKTDAELFSVTKDMDVDAEYISPEIPIAMVTDYDWLYSDDPADGDRSAYTLAQIYGIVRNGLAKDYFRVGDEIKLCPRTSVFPDTNIVMQVYGFNQYPLAEGNGAFAPVVFGMKGLMMTPRPMNSVRTNQGGWAEAGMRRFLSETIFPALPQRWKALIRPVELLYLKSGQTEEVGTCVDKLFLFAYEELFGTSSVPYIYEIHGGAENQTFALFTNHTSRIKKTFNGTGEVWGWWTRSPKIGSAEGYCSIVTNGGQGNDVVSVATTNVNRISFGFCL
ncbi:MAG: hypothetical protein IKM59_01565, partial [Oscillospiraceae bacterium]|nr:hypothetical protein [Oscillospiraceae bacterium]